MPTKISAKEWMQDMEKMARGAFKDHHMAVIGPGHWMLRNPKKSQYWCDIVVIANRGISVWGDIDGCFFAYCSGAQTPEAVIEWMAKADLSYYGRQKASIGMGGEDVGVVDYVDEVALYDLDEILKRESENYGEDTWNKIKDEFTNAILTAKRSIKEGEHIKIVQDTLLSDMIGIDNDAWEWTHGIGKVTSVRVIYALKAIERLHQLLLVE